MSALLAKSPRRGRRLSLHQHLVDTEQAACSLFRTGTRWADSYLRFFKVGQDAHDRFLRNLRVAALFHDIGKANSGFQAAMSAKQFLVQPFRHEHLSALVLAHREVIAWLGAAADLDLDVVTAAVLGHHLKAAESGKHAVLHPRSAGGVALHLAAPDVTRSLARIAEVLGIAPPLFALAGRYDPRDNAWDAARNNLVDRATTFASALRKDPSRRSMHMAVKAGLIAADSVASAMFREDLPIKAWIDEVAHRRALEVDEIDREILRERIAELEARRPGRRFAYHAFQDGAARLGGRGLLLAGCGAGKTMAAWRWANRVAAEHPIGRVIFLYPTRGTATEGFRDYVAHAPEGKAALMHASARYELAALEANPPEDRPPSLRDKTLVPDESEARLFALGLWPKRYFSATVDQFLSFIEHGYGGLCLVPALADAAVIFDEIHSYDHSMWRALVTFLSTFDLPVLCMTATLPPGRQQELARLGLEVYPGDADREHLADLERAECHHRYHVERVADEAAAMARVRGHIERGERVLWVVNTVARCQRVARDLEALLGRGVLVYHSRFTLDDRKRRHAEAVAAFKPDETTAAIAVTTQVCEMSLDLDADVLVTEHAPIPSLVQRFGRAHRHARDGRPPALVVVYPPESRLPYGREELAGVDVFLAELAGGPTSQRALAQGLIKHVPRGADAAIWTRFTAGGFYAEPGSLRDEDGSSVTAVLDDQVDTYLAFIKSGNATDGMRLSVPRKHARADALGRLPPWLMVADHRRYDAHMGFLVDGQAPPFAGAG